jgi:hypothetical protein
MIKLTQDLKTRLDEQAEIDEAFWKKHKGFHNSYVSYFYMVGADEQGIAKDYVKMHNGGNRHLDSSLHETPALSHPITGCIAMNNFAEEDVTNAALELMEKGLYPVAIFRTANRKDYALLGHMGRTQEERDIQNMDVWYHGGNRALVAYHHNLQIIEV